MPIKTNIKKAPWELINLKSEINVIKSAIKSCYDQEYFCTFVREQSK